MEQQLYRIIEHTADTGFEVRAASREGVFEAAATAFFQIMWKIGDSSQSRPENIAVHGGDLEELLVNFLEEFLYLYDAKNIVCTRIEVSALTDETVSATAWLQEFNEDRDRELLGVKAVTYHQLFIGRRNDGWVAQVFLDI